MGDNLENNIKKSSNNQDLQEKISQFSPRIIVMALKRIIAILQEEIETLKNKKNLQRVVIMQEDKVALFKYIFIQTNNIQTFVQQGQKSNDNIDEEQKYLHEIKTLFKEMRELMEVSSTIIEGKYYLGTKLKSIIIKNVKRNKEKKFGSAMEAPNQLLRRQWFTYDQSNGIFTDEKA